MANMNDIDQEFENLPQTDEEFRAFLAKDGLPVVERLVVDPETGEEILFQANYDYELDGVIDDYFDPNYDNETGTFYV